MDAEQVLIVNGAQHGLATTAMALLQPGDVVAVDALTYPGFKVLAETLQLDLAPIPGPTARTSTPSRSCARPVRCARSTRCRPCTILWAG